MPKTTDTPETNYILRDIPIDLWAKVKGRATLEQSTIKDVLFGLLKFYIRYGMPKPD